MILRFATTLFVSAMLLFTCQPLVARMIVPLLGGAPATWIVCSLVFQALLLAGYGYAHFLGTRFRVRVQIVLQLALVLSVFLVMPVTVDEALAERLTHAHPTLGLIVLIVRTVGLPFFVLSTTSPLLQRWFAELGETDPYHLYAASNAGSMLALLGYPFVVEPLLPVGAQSKALHAAYAAYTILLVVCATSTFRKHSPPRIEATPAPPAVRAAAHDSERPFLVEPPAGKRWPQRLVWIALAFAPSSLLLGATEYITTDIASIPLLWVVPLAAYLASFIVAFGKKQPVAEATWSRLLGLAAALTAALMINQQTRPTWIVAGVHLFLLFVGSVVCHRALARLRPPVARLTEFYLLLSVGGVLGGLFNGLVAPTLFDDVVEYPLAVGLVCVGRVILDPDRDATSTTMRRDVIFGGVLGLFALAGVRVAHQSYTPLRVFQVILLVALVVAFFWARAKPMRFAVALVGIVLAGMRNMSPPGQVIFADRSFFGILKVRDDTSKSMRTLVYGRIVHGIQSTDPRKRGVPLSYFHPTGPAGDVLGPLPNQLSFREARHVGVIGLGIGSLAAYARNGDEYTFFELNPTMETVARDYFTYIPDAEQRAKVNIEIGDARLRLRAGPAGRFDVLVLDAFSSDAIPTHLVTREALAVYRRALKPNGTLLAHVSNQHVDLKPVFAALARDAGMIARDRRDEDVAPEMKEAGKSGSVWVVLSESAEELMRVAMTQPEWTPLVATPGQKVWTDDFANVLGALR